MRRGSHMSWRTKPPLPPLSVERWPLLAANRRTAVILPTGPCFWRRRVGAPFPRGEARFKIEALLETVKLRLRLAPLAEAFATIPRRRPGSTGCDGLENTNRFGAEGSLRPPFRYSGLVNTAKRPT